MSRAKTKYPGITLISSNPSGYAMGENGSVEVPHGRPTEGQRLEDSNYYEFTADKDINDIMRSAGLPAGEIIMGPKAKAGVEQEAPKRSKKVSKKSAKEAVVEVKQKEAVDWDIPGIGSIKSEYTGVYVGESCVALHVGDGDNAFIPRDYRDNSQAVYIMKYKGYEYKVIYGGLNYRFNKCTVYVLIGGYNDRQEK